MQDKGNSSGTKGRKKKCYTGGARHFPVLIKSILNGIRKEGSTRDEKGKERGDDEDKEGFIEKKKRNVVLTKQD